MDTFRKHLLNHYCTIREALERLNILAKDAIVFIIDEDRRLIGSLTDGDVRRGLLNNISIDDNVLKVLQANPRYILKGVTLIEEIINYRENNFKIIPIVDKEHHVVNVINFRQLKSYLPIDTVIMAGGRGERLRPLTDTLPKPLLKVGDKSIIEHNLDRLALYGVDDYWITVRYLGEKIEDVLGDGKNKNINIQYVWENEPLGTIGAVSKINNFVHDYVLVTNSDLLTNIDYEHFFLDFLNQDADFSVVSIPYNVNIPYAVLETNERNVTNFKEKPTYTYFSNGGIYLMKKSVLAHLPIEKHFNTTDLMELLINLGKKVVYYPLSGYWLDIGKHEDFQKAQIDIKHIKL